MRHQRPRSAAQGGFPQILAEKANIAAGFQARFGADLASGEVAPVVDRVLPLAEAAEAHRVVQASEHFGKIVLQVG